jgi:hypothetical protein
MSGKDQGGSFILEDKLVIGREADCDVILDDDRVSRRHATVERTSDDTFRLIDHESTNGTFVQEERIEGSAVLVAGSSFRVGATVMSLVPTGETCSRCGQPIEDSVGFCGNCGHPIGTEAEIDVEALAAEIEQAAKGEATPPAKPDVEARPAAQPVSDTPAPKVSDVDLRTPRSKLKLTRRTLLIGAGVIILLGVVAACCALTVSGELFDFLEDLFYEIRYLF